jgi:hypothetical protein
LYGILQRNVKTGWPYMASDEYRGQEGTGGTPPSSKEFTPARHWPASGYGSAGVR